MKLREPYGNIHSIAPNHTDDNPQVNVRLLEMRLVPWGNVRALATVYVGGLRIRGVKVVQQPGQRAYVRLPDGKTPEGQYYLIVTCEDRRLKEQIDSVVLAAYNDLASGGQAQ